MKLISLSIENFGKLHRYDLSFADGLNTVCEENGWGKTTLAAFLKAMFYGLPKSGKKDLDENDYKHYTPWQGGHFGGTLTFSCKKGTFRVERSFGENEAFALFDTATGLASTAYSEALGKELFGIDAEGFEQSVFLSIRALLPKDGNDSIHAKLTGIDEIYDISNYEKAFQLLDDRAKEYKKRGGAGYIGETEAKIQSIKDNLAKVRELSKQQTSEEEELAAVRRQAAETTAEEKALQTALLRAGQVAEIRAFKDKLDEFLRQKADLESKFAGKIPTREELSACRNRLNQIENDHDALAKTGLTGEEQAELVSLSRRFPTGAPSAEVPNEKLTLATNLRAEQTSVEQVLLSAQSDLQNCEAALARLPSAEELKRAERLLESKKTTAKPSIWTVFFVLSLLLLPAGAVMLTIGLWQSVTPLIIGAAAALGAGVLCLIFHILLILKRNRSGAEEQHRFRSEINTLLERHGLPQGQDAGAALALLLAKRKDAETARAQALEKCRELTQAQQECRQKASDLRTYLASYEIAESNPESGLFALLNLSRSWDALWKKQKDAQVAEKQKNADIAALTGEVEAFLSRLVDPNAASAAKDRLAEMEELLARREALAGRIADRQQELEEKLAALGIADLSLLDLEPDPAALSARQKELAEILSGWKNNEARLLAQINRRAAETDKIPEWEEELARQTEALAEQKKRYALLVKTRDLLKTAHDDLTTRYLPSTRQNFAKYLALLCGKDVPKAELDAKFDVTVLDSGMSRQVESYSRGWRDLLRFCVRLSLIDALYADGEETPFLLLDDPFTNLDEERLAAAKALLGELAKSRQILYLVCHGDRV